MSNVIITSSVNLINVDFGIYSSFVGYKKGLFQKRKISIQLISDLSFVRVENSNGEHWAISYIQSGESLIVESVDGIAPTDNENLFYLLADLIA